MAHLLLVGLPHGFVTSNVTVTDIWESCFRNIPEGYLLGLGMQFLGGRYSQTV